ncbi:hypothetical protein Trydic_g3528 [Trypoxylus dichotomus]
MGDSSHFDDTLFAILKDCKTLPTFLDTIFGFLNRRTDFYVTTKEPNSVVGLPQGLAERLVRNTFYKWKPKDLDIETNVPEAVTETIVETTVEDITTHFNNTGVENSSESVPIQKKEAAFTSSEFYNGAVYNNYSWSQSISEVDVIVKVPPNITTKSLTVTILTQRVLVKLKNDNSIILEDKEKLEIHLEKVCEMWWNCFLQNEPKLDITKLDCSRPFEDLPDEAQAKIQELTWNQERKRLGLPTSDEIKMHEKLKKAWNAEGAAAELWEVSATQAFVDGIRDIEVQQTIRMGRHRKCSDALIHALQFEAAKQASMACHNVGELQVVFKGEKLRDINDRVGQLEEKFENLSRRLISKGNTRGNQVCCNCDRHGHIGSDYRATMNGSLPRSRYQAQEIYFGTTRTGEEAV